MRSTRMPLAAAAGVTVSIAASMNESGWSGCTSSRSLPELMRLMSSRSSMSCAWTRALRSMVSRPARSSSALRLVMRSTWAQPRMAFSGVRSSCDSVARNSSLASLTRSASARAARSLSSSALRSAAARCACS